MKWFRLAPAVALLGLMISGCDSGGIKEGAPTDTKSQSPVMTDYMKQNANKMQMPKSKPKNAGAAPKDGS